MLRRVAKEMLGRTFTTKTSNITASMVRSQAGMFSHLVPAVVDAVRVGEKPIKGPLNFTKEQSSSVIDTIGRTLAFLGVTNREAANSSFPLQLADSIPFVIPQVGLVDTVLKKLGIDPSSVPLGDIKKHVNFISYYRTIPSMEEFRRLGISYDQACEVIAKQLFMGSFHGDQSLNSRTVNMYFPPNSHMLVGSNDLGTTSKSLFAEMYAKGLTGLEAPFTIVNGGDTTAMTNGFHAGMKFMLESSRKGFATPILYLIQANGRSISSVLDGGAAAEAFRGYGKLFSRITEVPASEHEEALYQRDQLIDTILRTGRPAALVLNGKRIGGHATDSLLGSDAQVMESFDYAVQAISRSLLAVCTAERTPAQLADELQSSINTAKAIVDTVVTNAKTAPKFMSFSEARELTVKGSKETDTQGSIVSIPLGYWIEDKTQGEKTKSGKDIFGQAVNEVMDSLRSQNLKVKLVHQENSNSEHKHATLGVYDQFRGVSKENLAQFISNQLDEQFQATLAWALSRNGYFVMNVFPHTYFAASQGLTTTAQVAYSEFETGRKASVVTIVDAGTLTYPDGKNPAAAKLGPHHCDQGDPRWVNPNTICVIPSNAEHFRAMLQATSELVGTGRSAVVFFPTMAYPLEHKQLPIPSMSPFDVMRVVVEGYAPEHGRKVVIVTGGFITKYVIESLRSTGMAAEVLVMGSTEPSQALTEYLKILSSGTHTIDVVVVDPSPRAGLLGPMMNWTLATLKTPLNLRVLHATTDQVIIPYGAGNAAFVVQRDFVDAVLRGHNMIAVIGKESATITVPSSNTNEDNTVQWYFECEMDSEVTVNLSVGIGNEVKAGDVLGVVENGKSTREIVASADGVVSRIYDKVKLHETFTVPANGKVSIIDIRTSTTSAKAQEVQTTEAKSVNVSPKDVIVTPLLPIERAMAKAMEGKVFGVSGYLDLRELGRRDDLRELSKTLQITVSCAYAILKAGLNIKISKERNNRIEYLTANIGLAAMTPKGELVVLVVPSVATKSSTGSISLKTSTQIKEEVKALLGRLRDGKLKPEDTDLEKANVCLVVSSLGKDAPVMVNPVLPPSCTTIVGVGAEDENTGKVLVTINFCHATYTGKNAIDLLNAIGVNKDSGLKSFVERVVFNALQQGSPSVRSERQV